MGGKQKKGGKYIVTERKHPKYHILKDVIYVVNFEKPLNLNKPHPNPPQGEGFKTLAQTTPSPWGGLGWGLNSSWYKVFASLYNLYNYCFSFRYYIDKDVRHFESIGHLNKETINLTRLIYSLIFS